MCCEYYTPFNGLNISCIVLKTYFSITNWAILYDMNRNRFALLSLSTLMLLLLYKRISPFDHVTFCHRNVICVSHKSYACSHGSLCTCSSFKVHREQDLFWNKGESITAPLDRVNLQFCANFTDKKKRKISYKHLAVRYISKENSNLYKTFNTYIVMHTY